jgi:hypothetical protein
MPNRSPNAEGRDEEVGAPRAGHRVAEAEHRRARVAEVPDGEVDAARGAHVHASRVHRAPHLELEAGGAHEQHAAEQQRGRDDAEGEQLDEAEHAPHQEQRAGTEADEPTLAGQQRGLTAPCRQGSARRGAPR